MTFPDPTTWMPTGAGVHWQWMTPSGLTGGGNYLSLDREEDDFRRRALPRHNGSMNAAFLDGHAQALNWREFYGPLPAGWGYKHEKNHWDDK